MKCACAAGDWAHEVAAGGCAEEVHTTATHGAAAFVGDDVKYDGDAVATQWGDIDVFEGGADGGGDEALLGGESLTTTVCGNTCEGAATCLGDDGADDDAKHRNPL